MKKNPYTALLNRAQQFAFNLQHPHTRQMWSYPKDKLAGNWRLDALAERVQAADQLGYDVHLKVIDGSLTVQYVKRVEIPFEFQT